MGNIPYSYMPAEVQRALELLGCSSIISLVDQRDAGDIEYRLRLSLSTVELDAFDLLDIAQGLELFAKWYHYKTTGEDLE